MKLPLIFRPKVRAARLLTGILILTLVAAWSMNHAIKSLDETIESVFVDRLQPAVDLVFLSENLHRKRLLVQGFLTGHSGLLAEDVRRKLSEDNARSEALITSFEQTRLTDVEAEKLAAFKEHLRAYTALETKVLSFEQAYAHQKALSVFEKEGAREFYNGIATLHAIAEIQSVTGAYAVKSAHRDAAGGLLNTSLLIAVCITLALIILGLARNEKTIDTRIDYFNPN